MTSNEKFLQSLKDVVNSSKDYENKSMHLITSIIYSLEEDVSLYKFSKILTDKQLDILINDIGGETIKVPKPSSYNEKKVLSLIYYMRKIKDMGWNEIFDYLKKENIEFEENSIKLGKRISQIDNYIERIYKDTINE
jgi:hypothetical protein